MKEGEEAQKTVSSRLELPNRWKYQPVLMHWLFRNDIPVRRLIVTDTRIGGFHTSMHGQLKLRLTRVES
jgi:hypothetical protein